MLFQLLFTSFSFIFLPYPKTRDVYFGDLDSGSGCATEKSWEPGIWRPEKVEEMGYYYPLPPLFTDLLCNIGQVISLCSWVLSCAKWGGWTRCSLRSFQYFPLLWLSLSCWATSLPNNGPAELSVVLNTSFGTLGPCPVLSTPGDCSTCHLYRV